jgi:hypothetical protein
MMEISDVNLSQGPVTPPAPAGESAGAARPLPKGEGSISDFGLTLSSRFH